MAGFAAHTQFVRDDVFSGGQSQRPGGVAGETSQNPGGGIEGAIRRIFALGMSWRGGKSVDRCETSFGPVRGKFRRRDGGRK